MCQPHGSEEVEWHCRRCRPSFHAVLSFVGLSVTILHGSVWSLAPAFAEFTSFEILNDEADLKALIFLVGVLS